MCCPKSRSLSVFVMSWANLPVLFAVANTKVEMLFLHPLAHGQGAGSAG
jgi:hypothetical protein